MCDLLCVCCLFVWLDGSLLFCRCAVLFVCFVCLFVCLFACLLARVLVCVVACLLDCLFVLLS